MQTKAASKKVQAKWIPKSFRIDDEFGCLTHAERLAKSNIKLTFQVGKTRIVGSKKWGDHAWCISPKGNIIDPYFQWLFPNDWKNIEYVKDSTAFNGEYADLP